MWVFRISRPSVWNVRSKVYPTDLAPISHRGGSNSCLAFSVPELSVVFQPASLALHGTEDVVGGLLLSLALVLVSRRRVGLAGQAMGAGRMEGHRTAIIPPSIPSLRNSFPIARWKRPGNLC